MFAQRMLPPTEIESPNALRATVLFVKNLVRIEAKVDEVESISEVRLSWRRNQLTSETAPIQRILTRSQLKFSNAERRRQWDNDLLRRLEFVSAQEFAESLGSKAVENKRQLALNKRSEYRALAIKVGNAFRFPVFQIDTSTAQLYPEMAELLAIFPGYVAASETRGISVLRWLDQARPEFDGLSGLQVWMQGRRQQVISVAHDEFFAA